MLWSSEAFATLVESYYSALVHHLDDLTSVNRTWSVDCLILIPWVLLQLLVTEAQAAVLLVDFENYYIESSTY